MTYTSYMSMDQKNNVSNRATTYNKTVLFRGLFPRHSESTTGITGVDNIVYNESDIFPNTRNGKKFNEYYNNISRCAGPAKNVDAYKDAFFFVPERHLPDGYSIHDFAVWASLVMSSLGVYRNNGGTLVVKEVGNFTIKEKERFDKFVKQDGLKKDSLVCILGLNALKQHSLRCSFLGMWQIIRIYILNPPLARFITALSVALASRSQDWDAKDPHNMLGLYKTGRPFTGEKYLDKSTATNRAKILTGLSKWNVPINEIVLSDREANLITYQSGVCITIDPLNIFISPLLTAYAIVMGTAAYQEAGIKLTRGFTVGDYYFPIACRTHLPFVTGTQVRNRWMTNDSINLGFSPPITNKGTIKIEDKGLIESNISKYSKNVFSNLILADKSSPHSFYDTLSVVFGSHSIYIQYMPSIDNSREYSDEEIKKHVSRYFPSRNWEYVVGVDRSSHPTIYWMPFTNKNYLERSKDMFSGFSEGIASLIKKNEEKLENDAKKLFQKVNPKPARKKKVVLKKINKK